MARGPPPRPSDTLLVRQDQEVNSFERPISLLLAISGDARMASREQVRPRLRICRRVHLLHVALPAEQFRHRARPTARFTCPRQGQSFLIELMAAVAAGACIVSRLGLRGTASAVARCTFHALQTLDVTHWFHPPQPHESGFRLSRLGTSTSFRPSIANRPRSLVERGDVDSPLDSSIDASPCVTSSSA
jgi:hypothetical protein